MPGQSSGAEVKAGPRRSKLHPWFSYSGAGSRTSQRPERWKATRCRPSERRSADDVSARKTKTRAAVRHAIHKGTYAHGWTDPIAATEPATIAHSSPSSSRVAARSRRARAMTFGSETVPA